MVGETVKSDLINSSLHLHGTSVYFSTAAIAPFRAREDEDDQ